MCVEVTQDDRVTLGLEKELKGGGEMRRAGGDGRNVDVVYIYGDVVDSDGDGLVFGGVVSREKMVGGEGSVG